MAHAVRVYSVDSNVGPRDTIRVSNASHKDVNGMGQRNTKLFASYSHSIRREGVHVAHNILFHPWEQGSMVGF